VHEIAFESEQPAKHAQIEQEIPERLRALNRFELTYAHPSGDAKTVIVSSAALRDDRHEDVRTAVILRDITENGLQVAGLAGTVGVGKTLVLKPEGLADLLPFVLDAQCRWVKPATNGEESLAGFEITDISQQGVRELKNLIHALTLGS